MLRLKTTSPSLILSSSNTPFNNKAHFLSNKFQKSYFQNNYRSYVTKNESNRVVVTGIGIISPLGVGTSLSWERLLSGQSGIVSLSKENNPNNCNDSHSYEEFPSKVAGRVPDGEDKGFYNSKVWESNAIPRFIGFGLNAADQALTDAQFICDPESSHRVGVCFGSGMSCVGEVDETGEKIRQGKHRRISPYFVPRILGNMPSAHIAMKHEFQGPNLAPTTACAAGAHAIGDAASLVSRGIADVMVAGGSEACIHPITIAGFSRARSLSSHFNDHPASASRPFDAQRDGFVVSEGGAALILENLDHALSRGVERIYGEVTGYGMSCDAHHITSPSGRGASIAMRSALQAADINPKDVGYVNAHATSTKAGDGAELHAIHDMLAKSSNSEQKQPHVLVSSSKASVGHLLGAAGAIEAAFTILALHHQIIPPTINLNDTSEFKDIQHLLVGSKPIENNPFNHALSNSFGFGGTNASLLFSKMNQV